jgi:hypothetical protein
MYQRAGLLSDYYVSLFSREMRNRLPVQCSPCLTCTPTKSKLSLYFANSVAANLGTAALQFQNLK